MFDNSLSNSRSFNNSELSKGFHLLTESSHNVTINTPNVPLNTAHLYPRLAGSNWTCYLSQPSVVLGRSGTVVPSRSTRQKQQPQPPVGVDFGNSMAISRRHCEVRFSFRRDRWELFVYGRNGVKVNHVSKRPKDRPVVLTTGSLIEINNTTFVFILPNKYIKPTSSQEVTKEVAGDNKNDINVEDAGFDPDLENAVIELLEKHSCLDTKDIFEKLNQTYTHPLEKENILHLLVLSSRFQLAPNSISMSSKDSDSVKWMLINYTNDNNDTQESAKTSIGLGLSTSDMSIVTPSPVIEKNKSKGRLSMFESTDDMSIVSPAPVDDSNAPFSIQSSYSNEDDMSISAPTTNQNTAKNKEKVLRINELDDGLNIPAITDARRSENPPFNVSFRDGIVFRTPSNSVSILPPLQSNTDEFRLPTPSASFARFLDGDAGWSVFSPENQVTEEESTREADTQPESQPTNTENSKPAPEPILFNSMPIESIYRIWSSSTVYEEGGSTDRDETRPRKRTRISEMDSTTSFGDDLSLRRGISLDDTQEEQSVKQRNIYADVRTKILY